MSYAAPYVVQSTQTEGIKTKENGKMHHGPPIRPLTPTGAGDITAARHLPARLTLGSGSLGNGVRIARGGDWLFHMMESREVMNIREASQYLGVSPDTLYRYIYEARIPAFKLGNRWKFKKTILDRWMEKKITSGSKGKKR